MELLFTTTTTPGSYLIRKLTGESVSHVALRFESLVVQSGFGGVTVESYEDFEKSHNIVLRLPYSGYIQATAQYLNKGYDYGALLYLGVCMVAKLLHIPYSKRNLWNSRDRYLCTEFVTSDILGKDDDTITPYQLYKKLGGLK